MAAKLARRLARRLEQEALRHCFFGVFGWEGSSPDKTLLNPDVLGSLAKHYAGVLDELALAGELKHPALRLLSEFLTEPSVSTLGAMVDAIPPRGRMFPQPRGRSKPAADSCRACDEKRAGSGDSKTAGSHLGPAQVLDFIRQHEFRSAAVMLSRCAGYTHAEIAKKFGISRSRSYRHEKWFEGLPLGYRSGIITLGSAIRDRQEHAIAARPEDSSRVTLEDFIQAIQSPEALTMLQGADVPVSKY